MTQTTIDLDHTSMVATNNSNVKDRPLFPKGVSTDILRPVAPDKQTRIDTVLALSKVVGHQTRCFVALHSAKNPIYENWNDPSNLLSPIKMLECLQDETIPDHFQYRCSSKKQGEFPGSIVDKNKLSYADGSPVMIKPYGCPGVGFVPGAAGLIALDVDGLEAAQWLQDLGLWSQVLSAAETGFAWTSGKPHRFQVLVQSSPEILALFPEALGVVCPDPTSSLEIRYGRSQQSALPGSKHSETDGAENAYRLLSSNTPESLEVSEFWEPLAKAYADKRPEKPKTKSTPSPNAAARYEAIKLSSLWARTDYNCERFNPPCHTSDSEASGLCYHDTGVLDCCKCGFVPDLETQVREHLANEGIEFPPLHRKPETPKPKTKAEMSKQQRELAKSIDLMSDDSPSKPLLLMLSEQVAKLTARAPRFSPDEKFQMAQDYLADNAILWIENEDSYFSFNPITGCWAKVSHKTLKDRKIPHWAKTVLGSVPSTNVLADIADFIKAHTPMPFDRKNEQSFAAFQETVLSPPRAFANCFVSQAGEQIPLEDGAEFYALHKAQMEFRSEATELDYVWSWLEMFAGSRAKAGILLAYLGCCLYGVGADKHQKILNLYGASGAGKGDFIKLCQLISPVSRPRKLSVLEDSAHGLEGFDEADLIVMPDESKGPRSLENIKSLLGADSVSINAKHKCIKGNETVTANFILCQNGQDLLAKVEQSDRTAFERRQVVIEVTPKAAVPGYKSLSSKEHFELLSSQMPALVNYIYQNLSPEFCLDVISNADIYAPDSKADKLALNVGAGDGISQLINERLSFCPDGANHPLDVAEVLENLGEQYSLDPKASRFKAQLIQQLEKWEPIKNARLLYLRANPGQEKTAFNYVTGATWKTQPGKKPKHPNLFGNINLKLVPAQVNRRLDQYAALSPDELENSLESPEQTAMGKLTKKLLQHLPALS